eukprot:1145320-Pelagomonas_calceolata.AAC.8
MAMTARVQARAELTSAVDHTQNTTLCWSVSVCDPVPVLGTASRVAQRHSLGSAVAKRPIGSLDSDHVPSPSSSSSGHGQRRHLPKRDW